MAVADEPMAHEAGRRPALASVILAGLSLADLALLLAWLTMPGAGHGLLAWLVCRLVLAGAGAWSTELGGSGGEDGPGPRRWLPLATALWCGALPVFGAAIACLVAWPPATSVKSTGAGTWQSWALPARWDDPDLKILPPVRHEAPESITGDLLLVDRAHDGRRLHAMLRAARLPLRLQIPFARWALADPNDDVRLYAFSLIDRRRREHEDALQAARAVVRQAVSPSERARAHLLLAELAWEGAYHALYEASGLRESLRAALVDIDLAISLGAEDAALYALCGKILLRLGDPARSRLAFEHALALGHPAVKVLPFLAEAAFQQRRFAELRQYLAQLRAQEGIADSMIGRLRPVLEHWS